LSGTAVSWSETFVQTLNKPLRDPSLVRNRFMKALGTGRGGAIDA
jgi:hypothetical protein